MKEFFFFSPFFTHGVYKHFPTRAQNLGTGVFLLSSSLVLPASLSFLHSLQTLFLLLFQLFNLSLLVSPPSSVRCNQNHLRTFSPVILSAGQVRTLLKFKDPNHPLKQTQGPRPPALSLEEDCCQIGFLSSPSVLPGFMRPFTLQSQSARTQTRARCAR